jgi:osmotically-inducible protein OsmY
MTTPMSHAQGANPFSPLLSPRSSTHTVFDNGVEADISTITDRFTVLRDDRELLGEATRALRDAANVPKGQVVASVRDGIVTLEGRTSYYYERAAAECAVRFLVGVRSVENHVMVEPPPLAHEVRTCIAESLLRSAADEASHIAVQAVGGTVILQGVVHSRAERDTAERAAWSVNGVRSVIDNLIISS